MICIVGLLELDRAFHRREFVSFLYAQRHTAKSESVAYHTPCLAFCIFCSFIRALFSEVEVRSSNWFNFYTFVLADVWDDPYFFLKPPGLFLLVVVHLFFLLLHPHSLT